MTWRRNDPLSQILFRNLTAAGLVALVMGENMKRQENETLSDFVLRFMDAWCPRSTAKPHEVTTEFVRFWDGEFHCLCGNNPNAQGAYPCDLQGKEMEMPPNDDEPQKWCCDNCGRIFDGQTGQVVARSQWAKQNYKAL